MHADATVNSLGMRMLPIPAGSFDMGSADGDFDERPVHRVTIGRPFLMAVTEVTNAQYEQFDPAHRALRGKRGLSCADDEAVICVAWHDAVAFCNWLSRQEGQPYRLPTEAEWEYACRAGTTTPYHTGDTLPDVYHKHQEADWNPHPVSLRVGQTPPNAWGLHDMHGNVEEWCLDTYGPYPAAPQTDPVGCAQGDFRVTRGGSHNTETAYLRSANRLGTLAEDRHWLIGFRVVCGERPASRPLPAPAPARWAIEVRATAADWTPRPDAARPFFAPPQRFVHIPPKSDGPLYYMHNHAPSVTWCDNGDLLAVWFSTRAERGRELTIAASRLRAGAAEWDPAAEFFKAPDRNMTGSVLFNDGEGTLYHINGLEAGARWANMALVLRTSRDHGATWSHPRLIVPEHRLHNQPLSAMIRTRAGALVLPCDACRNGFWGTTVHVSRDGGATWFEPGANSAPPMFRAGETGGVIAGTHAGVVELADGRLMALGRSDAIDDRMPMSMSSDMGRTWTYTASPFPRLHWGQRLALTRLREGPLLLCSFTHSLDTENPSGIDVTDTSSATRKVFGLFAALSEDDGQSWPYRRLVTEDKPGVTMRWIGTPIHKIEADGAASPGLIRDLDASHAEPKGYLCCTQSPDGMIHLLSSMMHYQFNLAWLRSRPPPMEAQAP
jgi:formylglycine-generating enzyme required for sulfatase activity